MDDSRFDDPDGTTADGRRGFPGAPWAAISREERVMTTDGRIPDGQLATATSRRTVLKTGARLAYAAPLVVASAQTASLGAQAQDLVSPSNSKPRVNLALRSAGGLCLDVRLVAVAGNPMASVFRLIIEFDPGVLQAVSFVPLVQWDVLETVLDSGFAALSAGSGVDISRIIQGTTDIAQLCFAAVGHSGDCGFVSIRSEASQVLSISPEVTASEDILDPNFVARTELCLL